MNLPAIPLLVAKNIEQQKSWEGISTPYDLALYFAKILSVDPSKILQLQEVIYSDVQPTGDDAKKLWVKTDEPVGFGIPTGEGYSVVYRYPPNTPILWTVAIEDLPAYMRKMTSGEIGDYKLVAPDADKATWVIFNI